MIPFFLFITIDFIYNSDMKIFKSEKFQKIFYPIFYILFAAAITVSGCFIFNRYYYTNIFVSGPSMLPTLVGDDTNNIHHYGIADTTSQAIEGMKRFDVCITYYPDSWGTRKGLIVKRVWGFPGERLVLNSNETQSEFTVYHNEEVVYQVTAPIEKNHSVDKIISQTTMDVYEFNVGHKVFYTAAKQARTFDYTLGNDEYFVMGDHWGDSTDSYVKYTAEAKLTRKYIQGRIICIQGYGKVVTDDDGNYKIYDKVAIKPIYKF